MNGLQGKKASRLEKPYPGCMGRMVNLFDLSTGSASNRLLTEKAHREGSPNPRTCQDVSKRAVDSTMPNANQIEEKPIAHVFRRASSSKQVNRTPMKLLIAQEISKETESKQKLPSVVARLMGLDALPAQQPLSSGQRNSTDGHLCNMALGKREPHYLPVETNTFTHSGTARRYWQQENTLPEKQISHEMHPSLVYEQEQQEYKDVYEVWQSSKVKEFKACPMQKGRYNENLNENKMALVRQKFIEAKRLATDEKLRQSKEFQDALEVLSSNRDLFLKFLREPNSLFSNQPYDLQSLPPQSKRITVLKPSKNMTTNGSGKQCYASERCIGSEMKFKKHIRRHDSGNYPFREQQQFEANGLDNKPSQSSGFPNQSSYVKPLVKADIFSQPTRIVVLKPSPGKAQDIKALVSSPISSPRPHGKDFYGSNVEKVHKLEENGPKGSREIARDITLQMQESLSCDSMRISNRRDEALLSSALSNGYVGDESSFNRSENEYLEAENLSDSEVTTLTSRHSWDYINRLSPNSSSSFSRASCSPESLVSREAKKRLSERWAIMASGSQELEQVQRSSSTLGEMLALPERKKPSCSSKESSDEEELSISSSRSHHEEASRELTRLSSSSRNDEGVEDSSPRNLPRSRSVPVSSTTYEKVELPSEVPEAELGKPVPMEVSKLKNGRSLKGKLSSLFFSRNGKSSREKVSHSSLVGSRYGCLASDKRGGESVTAEEMPAGVSEVRQQSLENNRINEDNLQCVTNGGPNEMLDNDNVGASCKASSPSIGVISKVDTHSSETSASHLGVISLAKSGAHESSSENQNQPSPISVLEGPFEDDLNNIQQRLEKTGSDLQVPRTADLHHHLESAIINRNPLVSVTRPLSWDDSYLEAGLPCYSQKPSTISSELEEEQERLLFVQNMLLASGLGDKQCALDLSRWHSSNCPLDPSLLEKFVNCKEENDRQLQQEAKRRQRRSERRLLFDSVNAALVEIVGPILDFNPWVMRDSATSGAPMGLVGTCLENKVWNWVSGLFSGRGQEFSGEEGGQVEVVVRKEMGGTRWLEMLRLEMDGIGREIERQVIDELIEGAVSEFAGAL